MKTGRKGGVEGKRDREERKEREKTGRKGGEEGEREDREGGEGQGGDKRRRGKGRREGRKETYPTFQLHRYCLPMDPDLVEDIFTLVLRVIAVQIGQIYWQGLLEQL